MAKEVGLAFVTFLLIGYPGETDETFKETLDFVRRAEPDDVAISFATPHPHTKLYEMVKENGWKMCSDWSRFDNITAVFENPSFPAKTMMEARRKLFNQFYSPSNILRQSLKRTHYSRLMARTALNYQLTRIRLPRFLSASLKKAMPQQSALKSNSANYKAKRSSYPSVAR
jgi:radical SAM superfamily enzyme YgiQ (UPF0313 family)